MLLNCSCTTSIDNSLFEFTKRPRRSKPDAHSLQSFEVEKALQNVNVRKSTGWDGIPPMALKLGATELTNPLTSLFNSCITLGEWPLGWKRGEWTPVFKKEDPHEKGNYRPITVQVTVNKRLRF